MKTYGADSIRNIVILGHSGCGKTTMAESILNICDVTKRMGTIENGNTISDFSPEEIKRKISINASMIPVEWQDTKINFIDVPGYFDYVGEMVQAMSVADLALIVVSAKSGVTVGVERAFEYATNNNIPKMFFVNKMDSDRADFDKVVLELKEKFGKTIAPLQVPFKEDGKVVGFINVIKKEGRRFVDGGTTECDVPSGVTDEVDFAHDMICESVAETDDSLMEKFFEGEKFSVDELEEGIKQGIIQGSVAPVFCGAASMKIGIRILLYSIAKFLPTSANLREEVDAIDLKSGQDFQLKYGDDETFTAFVFKTIADPYIGKLSLFKVTSGIMKKDTSVRNANTGESEKISNLFILRGKEQIPVEKLKTGDIGCVSKLSNTNTGDTLCDKVKEIKLNKTINYPDSLMIMCIKPQKKGEEDKLASAFSKLMEEDKTFKYKVDKETKETLIYCIGESHIDVIISKLKNIYKLEVELSDPTVPYREMLKSKIKVQGKYKKQSGGHGQFGDVHIEFEPSGDLTSGFVFEEKIFGGAVPKQYFPAVEKGLAEAVKEGPLAGYPVVGIKATLVDGSYHPVDSSEMAFKMATIAAFKKAFEESKTSILEPISTIKVNVPEEYTGDILGDISKRGGKVLGMEEVKGKQVITGEVPLAELFKYPVELRAMTQGRGTFEMSVDRYDEVTSDMKEKIISERK